MWKNAQHNTAQQGEWFEKTQGKNKNRHLSATQRVCLHCQTVVYLWDGRGFVRKEIETSVFANGHTCKDPPFLLLLFKRFRTSVFIFGYFLLSSIKVWRFVVVPFLCLVHAVRWVCLIVDRTFAYSTAFVHRNVHILKEVTVCPTSIANGQALMCSSYHILYLCVILLNLNHFLSILKDNFNFSNDIILLYNFAWM